MNLSIHKVKETMAKKTPLMRLTEHLHGAPIEQLIARRIEAGMNWKQIAAELDVPYPTLNDWRRDLGIEVIRTVRVPAD